MLRAIDIAKSGFGFVEPNPMVGAVIASRDRVLIAEGFHQSFGEAHAEINAICSAKDRTRGADLFVSLEPCSHFGKTPPCADAVIAAGFRRVVVGCLDPAPHVAGAGIQRIRDAGIQVDVGVCERQARRLIAPFEKLMLNRVPWVHAKWAMTLDGRIASRTGHSKWISCEQSRKWVHDLRGRVDAIITGSGTVRADNPQLTARPAGPRRALRVVIDSTGDSVNADGALLKSRLDSEILVCVSARCRKESRDRLLNLGVSVFQTESAAKVDVAAVMRELGLRKCTNVLLEAGPALLGAFFDEGLIDEIHAFVAPKLIGGLGSLAPIGGAGFATIPAQPNCESLSSTKIGDDLLIEADVSRKSTSADLQHG